MRFLLPLALASALVLAPDAPGKKKNKEEATQVLALPMDPPAAVTSDTRRLTFHTSHLVTKGLLSQQTRDALRQILKDNSGLAIVHLRAFVSGAGDMRRVPQLVSELFSEKKHAPLPSVSVVQVGGLPLDESQIVIETIAEAKKDVNPSGLLFIPIQDASRPEPLQPLLPLAEQALSKVAGKLAGAGEALRVTCFVSQLEDVPRLQSAMSAHFPGAALDLVQTQRSPSRSSVACEAVARALAASPAAVNSDHLILTGTQLAFGFSPEDARLAFRRMDRVLAPFGASLKQSSMLNFYPLSSSIAAQVQRVSPEFLDAARRPAITSLPFEGLPGLDASFAIEAMVPQ